MKKKTRQRWPQRLSQRLALAEPVEQATPAVRPRLRAVIAAVSCLALVGLLPANARAIAGFNTIVVTRADDPSSGGNTCSTNPITDSDCSLRNALADAADGQTVSFRDGVTGPYRVTQPKALDIGHNVHLSGLGAGTTTIEGSVGTGVIKVDITATDAAISGVTITGGNNGAPPGTGIGGGIFNMGTLTISDSVVTLNKALFAGGGIESRGMLTVIRSTISDNAVGTPNSSGFGGGTEIESGSARFVNSTISGNVAMSGLSTPPGVVAAGGGLAILGGTLELANVTLADNTVSGAGTPLVGGNLWTRNGISVVRNTIIAAGHGPAGAENCGGHLTSLGHNIEDRDQCGLSGPGDQVNTDPQVGLLQDNGGPTPTQAPAPDSPAIDHGDPSGCADLSGSPLSTDQRGAPRPQAVACDAGAYELQPVAPAAALRTPTAAARSATLLGTIDTHGFPTTWHFDYGPTSQYGSSNARPPCGRRDRCGHRGAGWTAARDDLPLPARREHLGRRSADERRHVHHAAHGSRRHHPRCLRRHTDRGHPGGSRDS